MANEAKEFQLSLRNTIIPSARRELESNDEELTPKNIAKQILDPRFYLDRGFPDNILILLDEHARKYNEYPSFYPGIFIERFIKYNMENSLPTPEEGVTSDITDTRANWRRIEEARERAVNQQIPSRNPQ